MKYLRRLVKTVLFLTGVAFVAFWAWVMWDAYAPNPILDLSRIEIPRP